MRERGDRIKDAAKVFDEMLAMGKVKPSLRNGSGSRMREDELRKTYPDLFAS
jgi:pentatricopeptide repeat protein